MADAKVTNEQPETEAVETVEAGTLDQFLKKSFKLKDSDQDKVKTEKIKTAVQSLVESALQNTTLISDDAYRTIEALISEIDRKLSEQVNMILHHNDFRALEGSWRGLHHMVTNTETDETLKIRVMNISKSEVAKTLKKFPGAGWDQSPLFKQLYEQEYGAPGGEPYGAIVGDYHFDHSPPDIEILKGMAQIAAAAHAPFIAGTSPSLMDMESWRELSNPRDLTKIFQSPEYAAWRSLRKLDDAKYLGLTMPRFLSRYPYGAKTNPVEEFAFEEETGNADHDKYTWSNSAYAMGTNIMRSFKLYGWCACIRGVENGGIVEGLPTHTFPTDDGGVDMKCPTEIAITDRREAELSKNGMLPLVHWKNTDYSVFIGGQSVNDPDEYDDDDATANARLAARLPYLFASCRFAHFLKCMVRDKIGSFKERADMEKWLNKWIMQYVTSDSNAADETKAKYPLAAAEVQVKEVEGNPGYYTSTFWLRPHYQLEGLKVSLRLVSKLPTVKGG